MAISLQLPATVRAILAERLDGVPRADLAKRATAISAAYRAQAPSAGVIASPHDALAYAIVRMPATFAATRRVLDQAVAHLPEAAPASLLDVGAGPGTAALAAIATWSTLQHARLVEPNAHLAAFAHAFTVAGGITAQVDRGTIGSAAAWSPADLVMASYVQVELEATAAATLVEHMAQAARSLVVLVEPGTKIGFARIRRARDVLTAAGWTLAAPCPHGRACPLPADDWCHFSVRVARSKDHKLVKGADAPFEDEPYSYLIATRYPVRAAPARILRAPVVGKTAVDLALCTADGLAPLRLTKAGRDAFKLARKADAGDAWPLEVEQ